MRLCFGTYAKVLLRCRRTGVTQVELGREMLLSVNGNVSVHYSDSSISDLVNGRKNRDIPMSSVRVMAPSRRLPVGSTTRWSLFSMRTWSPLPLRR